MTSVNGHITESRIQKPYGNFEVLHCTNIEKKSVSPAMHQCVGVCSGGKGTSFLYDNTTKFW